MFSEENNLLKVEYSYNEETDSVFISRKEDYVYDESVELNNNIILDFDNENIPSALEILDASKIFKVSKSNLNHMNNLNVHIIINKETIKIKIELKLLNHNETVNSFVANNSQIPSLQTELISV